MAAGLASVEFGSLAGKLAVMMINIAKYVSVGFFPGES